VSNDDLPLGATSPTPSGDTETAPDAPLAAVSQQDADLGIEDATRSVAPEDFDFAAFVEGARPGRRAVTLSPRGDLIAEMERIIGRIEKAGDTEAVDALVAEYEQTKAEFESSRRVFVVEARSSEWIKNVERTAKKQHKLDPGKSEDRLTIMLRQIAGQVVIPSGVTAEGLRKLYEASEVEVDKLWRACQSANSTSGVVPDFPGTSRRRSAGNQPG
jgi:hypothetical protein